MLRRQITQALIASLVFCLAACNLPAPDQEADAAARRLYLQIRDGADPSNDASLGPAMRGPWARTQYPRLRDLLPRGNPTRIENRGFSRLHTDTSGSTAMLTHVYVYRQGTVTAWTYFIKPRGAPHWRVIGVRLMSQPATARGEFVVSESLGLGDGP